MQRPIDPAVVFGTPCAVWEETSYHLLQLGVPQDELPSWQILWRLQRWNELKKALEQGWDPQESISTFLDDFCLSLGNGMYRCLAPENNGGACGRDGERKDRTISHMCEHLGYNPYVCGGACENVKCTQRFSEKRTLDQHTKKDAVQCPKCYATLKHKRNLGTHMASCRY